MTLRWNLIIQALATAIQLWDQFSPFIPEDYRNATRGLLVAIQGFVAVLAHNFNTDGTPQAMPKR